MPVVPMLALLLALLVTPKTASTQSFDCARAQSRVERAICGNRELGRLDVELAAAYRDAMALHPLPSYVRARQRDWLTLNRQCESSQIVACLRDNYRTRIAHLRGTTNLTVYASAQPFSHAGGDLVAEYWLENNRWRLSVWGGFALDRVQSESNGRPTLTGCEFEGTMVSPQSQQAVSAEGTLITFQVRQGQLEFGEDTEGTICYGYGRMPSNVLTRVRRR